MVVNGTNAAGNTGTGSTGGTGSAAGAGSNSPSGAGAANSATTLGGTNFLTLMLAQLKNQDPTSPVDSNTFLTQLAQLSEVQGITQLNTSFSTLSSALSPSQALQASSLLGHKVLAASATANLTANGTVTGAVNVPQTTSQVLLDVKTSSGVLVRQINLGAQSTGLASFSWDGKMGDGTQAPAGTYTLSAQYAGATSGTTGLTLNVTGLGSVPFSSVQQISN